MLKHIVMFKMKETETSTGKIDNTKKLKRDIETLKDKIDVIEHIEAGLNISESKNAYDLILYSEFRNEDDLNTYREHPEHKKVLEFIKDVVEDIAAGDYLKLE